MHSMTGYGKGIAVKDGRSVTIELKTVNHRYLDWGVKMPKNFLFLEDSIKKTAAFHISRGHIDLYLTYEQSSAGSTPFCVDDGLAASYMAAAEKLSAETGLENDLTLSALMRAQDIVFRASAEEDETLLCEITLDALNQALENLKAMRKKEGESLHNDIVAKLNNIRLSLDKIVALAPRVVEDYRNKLTARISEALSGVSLDEARLATEVAIFADRCSIDEETTRLAAHIENMKQLLECDEPVGRKLDFLVQELNRETNTIGSKANDYNITAEVLAIKNEIEKIREQAQNVE